MGGYVMEHLISEVLNIIAQVIVYLALAPLVCGCLKKVKAWMQNRRGSSVFQEYLDVAKWWKKPTYITSYAGQIFLYAPMVYFLSVLLATAMLPRFMGTLNFGDIFLFVSILAIGRFFMVLSSLDSGTAFGGMGGSRELFISVLAEPVFMLSILSLVMHQGTSVMQALPLNENNQYFTIAGILTCCGFFAFLLAENGRIPVDNPDTHLELTMIHECMTLEYSGRLLAVIHLASMLKTFLFIILFSLYFFPVALPLVLKIPVVVGLVAVVEGLNNKMRLFRAPLFLWGATLAIILAVVAQ